MSAAESTGLAPAETARAYFEALAARDLDAAMEFWAPDGIEDIVPLRVYRGTEEIRGALERLRAAMPDLEMTVGRVTADERVAVVEWRGSGTFSGTPFEGIDPTGSEVQLRAVDCLEVEEGKIVRNAVYYDGTEFARAIGMLPKQDSGAERAMLAAFNGATRVRSLVREQLDR